MTDYYPAVIRLSGKQCVVIGGGEVASRRIEGLLEAGADVTVVAPSICTKVSELTATGRVKASLMPYDRSCLLDAFLVVAATNDPETNRCIAVDANDLRVLCNNADEPEQGDLVVPATVRRGSLLISVTTLGSSPTLAATIKTEIADRYGAEYEPYVNILGDLRAHIKGHVADTQKRKALILKVARNAAILDLIREGRLDDARAEAFSCISSSLE